MFHLFHDLLGFLLWYWQTYCQQLNSLCPLILLSTAVCGAFTFVCYTSVNYKRLAYSAARHFPGVKVIVQREIDKAIAEVHHMVHGDSRVHYITCLPDNGLQPDNILHKLRKYKAAEYVRWNEGYASGTVYPREGHLGEVLSKVFEEFIWTNPLHADVFPDVRRMEAEIVRMCLTMFHGDDNSCGVVTSGGTESIMLACLAYRELAKSKGILHPAMVVPESAHPAFDKAAAYFCIEVIRVPIDRKSLKVNVKAMRRALTRNTCMLVGSAPGFPHGIIDPIKEIAALGHRCGIPVHVDCCLGGFLLPFMEPAGFPVEPFDFLLPGVTSISCDTHKYGFTAKGTSVILYRNKRYRSMQFFTQPDWSGGLYASPTFAGSRSGALIAVCWATLMYFGRRGYIESTRRIVRTTRYIAEELEKIPGLHVIGLPLVSVVAFGSDKFDIYQLAAELSRSRNGRGWNLNNLQSPPAVHLCVTDQHTAEGVADRFLQDVSAVAGRLIANPHMPSEPAAVIYGMCATLPDRSIVAEVAKGFLNACYETPDPDVPTHRSQH